MLFPIPGAVEETRAGTWPATGALTAHSLTSTAAAVEAVVVNGPVTRLVAGAVQAGVPEEAAGAGAVQAGTPTPALGPAAASLTGETVRPAASGLTVSSAAPSRSAPTFGVVTLRSSLAQRTTALAAYNMRRLASHPARASAAVRAVREGGGANSCQVALSGVWPTTRAVEAGGVVSAVASAGADVRSGSGFLILADVVEAEVESEPGQPPAGYYTGQFITGRLFVNGDEVDISDFDYERPAGKLGASLNVTLTYPSLQPVPLGAVLRFELVVEFRGRERVYVLLDGGRLGGRDISFSVSRGAGLSPADQATASGVDVMQDKFSLRPTRPVVMYDADQVAYHEVEVQHRDAIQFVNGAAILPVIEPYRDLTMWKVLRRAFTAMRGGEGVRAIDAGLRRQLGSRLGLVAGASFEDVGLGFERVVTNIPDYPVRRADFTIQGGWKDGADPFVAMFDPAYVPRASALYILDTERVLPAGFVPRAVTIDDYLLLSLSWPYKDNRNAVLVTHMADADETELFYTFSVETPDPQESGTFGQPGHTKTETSIRWREARLFSAPEVVIDKFQESVETRTYVDYGFGDVLSHKEVEQATYDNGLKTGHDKRVYGLLTVGPTKSLVLREVLREQCSITWKENPLEPGGYLQARNDALTTGLVYESEETQTVLTPEGEEERPLRVPALWAQKSGWVTDEGSFGEGQPIKRVTQVLRQGRGNQLDVAVTEINFLTGTVDRSVTQPTTGSRVASHIRTRQVTTLLFDADSEAAIGPRIPESVNAGELPRDRALELGQRVLGRLTTPRAVKRLNLSGADVTLDRGSVIRAFLRDGTAAGDFIVLGYGVKGVNLGRRGHNVTMSVEGAELPTG